MTNQSFINETTNIIEKDLEPVDLKKTLTKGNLLITKKSLESEIEIADNCLLEDVKISLHGSTRLIIEEGAELLNCNIYSNGNHNDIRIGKNCKLKGLYLMCCDDGNSIDVGENTTVHGEFWGSTIFHTMEKTTIKIGKDCMLSGNIVLRTTDGHAIINSEAKRINPPQNIIIGNHVWIGMNAMILKGCEIGTGCIIGANSVVTHSFDTYTIIAGNPAKKINKIDDFDWQRSRGFNFTLDDYRK